MKWFIYRRGTIGFNRLATTLESIHEGITTKLGGAKFEHVLYFSKGPKLWWAWHSKEIKNFGNHILKACRTKHGATDHFKKFIQYTKTAFIAAEKVRQINLKQRSNQELINLYDYLYKETSLAHGLMDVDVDAIDVVFEDFLRVKLRKELSGKIKDKEFLEIYKKISLPIYQSFISKQEQEIIKVALKNRITKQDVKKLYNELWWTKLGWENMIPHTEKYFTGAVKKYLKLKNLEKKLKLFKEEILNVKKQRRILIKKYGLSKEIEYWLKVLDKYFYYHDLRKEMQVKTIYANYLLVKETARRLKLKVEDLEWFWRHELQDVLRGKPVDKKEIARRKKAVFVLVSKKEIKIFSGQAAIRLSAKVLKEKVRKVRSFNGLGVSEGKVKAKVKVCSGAQEALKKIKKGDILVCPMTLPDYVPAMRKVSAIITNEGGITCHAAIISRELGIPCIVGTKIATQVLKDGDRVEMDANKGVVKILK